MLTQMLKLFKRNKIDKNFALDSGERQIADTVDNIREDHLARYRLVDKYLKSDGTNDSKKGLDLFCGNGYGTFMLSDNHPNLYMTGIDGSREAIELAKRVYALQNNEFYYKLFPFKIEKNIYDLIVCFESLEHVEEDKKMFKEMTNSAKKGALIFISVPNDKLHSLEKNPHKFHFRHYKHEEFLQSVPLNLKLIEWYGQNVYKFENGICTGILLSNDEMQPTKEVEGQVNIYVFEKV